jgi:hypothetical protein
MQRQHDKTIPAVEVTLTAHPPERPRNPTSVTLPCGCCCCCCCCLHTIGGLIGGIVGSVTPIPREPRPVDPDFPFPFRRDEEEEDPMPVPAGVLYWIMLMVSVAAATLYYYWKEGRQRFDDLYLGVLVALFFLPGLQIAATIASFIVVGLFYTDKVNATKRIARITGWSLAGTALGIALMGGFCGLLSLWK